MTDVTDLTEFGGPQAEPTENIEKKPKREMTEERKAQLAAARAKAMEKRRMLADLTKKEREIKEMALKERIEKIKVFEEKKALPEKPKPVKKVRLPPPPPETESEESESESDESDSAFGLELRESPQRGSRVYRPETEVPVRKPRAAPSGIAHPRLKQESKPKQTGAYAADIAREELRKKIERENMNIAFRSIFPNAYTLQF
jgi:hypothetical protein